MSVVARTAREIEAAIDAMTGAYRSRNLADVMACFAPDSDAVLIGTGGDERRVGPEEIRLQVERDWGQTDAAEMAFSWKSIGAAGDVAWAALQGAFNVTAGGQALSVPIRCSLVFERRDGRWLIVHSHYSVPAAGQEEGSSF
jgi:uncharacterized protein (TIGR02246 family)